MASPSYHRPVPIWLAISPQPQTWKKIPVYLQHKRICLNKNTHTSVSFPEIIFPIYFFKTLVEMLSTLFLSLKSNFMNIFNNFQLSQLLYIYSFYVSPSSRETQSTSCLLQAADGRGECPHQDKSHLATPDLLTAMVSQWLSSLSFPLSPEVH